MMAIKLLKGKNVNTLFFSNPEKDNCHVYDLWLALTKVRRNFIYIFWRHFSFYLISKWYAKQSVFIKEFKIKNIDYVRLIIFGHKHDDYPALNCVDHESFGPEWFDKVNPKTIVIMFVAGGAQILDRIEWSNKIKKYVSFKDKFSMLRDFPLLQEEGDLLFPKLIKSTFETSDVKIISQNFSNLFLETQKRIKKNQTASYSDIRLGFHLVWINDINLVSKERT